MKKSHIYKRNGLSSNLLEKDILIQKFDFKITRIANFLASQASFLRQYSSF